jgi:hypothetical protein
MDSKPVPRITEPVASELLDWEERASAGDEMAQRAVAKDPIAIATLRQEFAERRKASY